MWKSLTDVHCLQLDFFLSDSSLLLLLFLFSASFVILVTSFLHKWQEWCTTPPEHNMFKSTKCCDTSIYSNEDACTALETGSARLNALHCAKRRLLESKFYGFLKLKTVWALIAGENPVGGMTSLLFLNLMERWSSGKGRKPLKFSRALSFKYKKEVRPGSGSQWEAHGAAE